MITLYEFPLSGHSHKARLMLSLLKVPHERVTVSGAERAHKAPEFLAMNPFGQVPVLRDGDLVLRDSATLSDLLDAEESITSAELTLAQNQRQQSLGFINLNVSLGSGHASERASGQNLAPPSN